MFKGGPHLLSRGRVPRFDDFNSLKELGGHVAGNTRQWQHVYEVNGFHGVNTSRGKVTAYHGVNVDILVHLTHQGYINKRRGG